MKKDQRIISIMTVYFPTVNNVKNAKKIAAQSDLLIICDNSNCNNGDKFTSIDNIRYFYFGENLGLSAAFNRVLKDQNLGWNLGDYVIFFDQDSVIPERHIEKLVDEYESLEIKGYLVGAIGPVYFNTSSQKEEVPHQKKFINQKTMITSSIITTSMLCKYKNLKKIDFWNEKIFLDMADWDICWRLQEKEMKICLTYASVIRHSLGEGEKHLGLLRVRVGKPFREYYQTRDCLTLLRASYAPIKYKIRFFLMLTLRPVLHLLTLDHKSERIHYICRGIKDAIQGYHGALKV